MLAYDEFIASCRAAGFSPAIVQEASSLSALGLVAAGLGVTVVAASDQALSMDGVRFVPVIGYQRALQVAWAAGNTNTALPGFLETARQIASSGFRTGRYPAASWRAPRTSVTRAARRGGAARRPPSGPST